MIFLGRILAALCTLSALTQDGTLVDLGTHKLNIVSTGAADTQPVVILEAGGGGSSTAWKGVQAALPGTAPALMTAPALAGAIPARNPAAWRQKFAIFTRFSINRK
jgi:hypothetical protein